MSKVKFVYCFIKKLSTNMEQYTINLQLLEKSIKDLSKHYPYRLITDLETLDDVKSLTNKIEIVNSDSFIFLDDFKISLIEKLNPDEVIIDPDLFVFNKLDIDLSKAMVFEHKDKPYHSWYKDHIEELKGTLLYDRIKTAGKLPFVPNIGFFKMSDKKLRAEFLKTYRLYRDDLCNKVTENRNRFNLLLGQYLMGIVLYEGNYSYFYTRGTNTVKVYSHLAGPDKYKKFKLNKPVI